jgi:hypothetical protein
VINPTEKDIGRGVVYRPALGKAEDGKITSFNEYYVFVRYGGNGIAATRREDLTWLTGSDTAALLDTEQGDDA